MTKLKATFRNFVNAPNNSTFCPHSAFVCFVGSRWGGGAITSIQGINRLVFIQVEECVYSAVRTEFLNIIQARLNLQMVSLALKIHAAMHDYHDMIYLLTAIGLTPGGSSTVHIYTQTIHRNNI